MRFWIALALVALTASPVRAQSVCPSPWKLEETFRMGSTDGPDALTDVRSLELDAAGNLYVTQFGVPWVTVFDRRGNPLRTLGSAGQGPGEFAFPPIRMGWKGDTLWVSEPMGPDHLFLPDGRQIARLSFKTIVAEESSAFFPARLLADGSVLGARSFGFGAGMQHYADVQNASRLPLLRFGRSGRILDTIVMIPRAGPGDVEFVVETAGGGISKGGGHHPLYAWGAEADLPVVAAADGSSVVFVSQGAAERSPFSPMRLVDRMIGPRATFDLLRVGIQGDTIVRRSIQYRRTPIGPRDEDMLRDGFATFAGSCPCTIKGESMLPPARVAERRRAARAALTLPEFYPPVRQIVAGRDGTIWLLREIRPDRADLWEVYGSDGRLEGSVLIRSGKTAQGRIPWAPRMELLRAARDEVWTMTEDELDVPTIRRYRVDRSCNG